tara:strand:+ start:295 stop:591 length:297 start_codon:yes stop_codon:yes gene_type:complete
MAKIKNPKVKNPRPKKITQEQLNKMQTAISNINKIQFDLGALEARKHELLHVHFKATDAITTLQDEFKKQYGSIDIDVQDGTIKYGNDGTHNKKNNSR